MKRAVVLLAASGVLLAAGRARGDQTWTQNQHATNQATGAQFSLDGLPVPVLGTSPLRLQDLALGSCLLKVAGSLPFACGAAGADFQAPMSAADSSILFPTASTIRLRDVTGLSVMGRSGSSTGPAQDITATGDGLFFQRLAGALTWAPIQPNVITNSNLVAAPAASIKGVPGSSSATPTDTAASGPSQVPMSDPSAGTTWSWTPISPSTAGTVATWSITGVRVYAVDALTGSDANSCWADSADTTQANVAVATASAGTHPCQTFAGLVSKIPPVSLGRSVYIVFANSSAFAESPAVLAPIARAYPALRIRGTGTSSTAGATAFSGSTGDLIYQGARTCSGMNAAGYHPSTSSGGSSSISLSLAGGGTPTFAAEPAKPIFCRVRFDSATATSALQNTVYSVVKTSGSAITINSSIAYSTSDTLYLEEPGVLFSGGSFVISGSRLTSISGINFTAGSLTMTDAASVSAAFVATSNSMSCTNAATCTMNTVSSFSAFPVGPSRSEGALIVTGAQQFVAGNATAAWGLTGAAGSAITSPIALAIRDYNVFGGNVTYSGSSGGGIAVALGGQQGAASPMRIFGTLTINGGSLTVNFIDFPTTAAYGLVVGAQVNQLRVGGALTGATKTDAGINLADAGPSQLWFWSANPSTLTGTNGDIYWGLSGTANTPQGIYQSWASLYFDVGQRSSAYLYPVGTMIFVGPDAAAAGTFSGQVRRLTAVQNYNSGVTLTPGMIVRSINTDGIGVVPAQANIAANALQGLAVAWDNIQNLKSGFAIFSGETVLANLDPTDTTCTGVTDAGHQVWLSAATAGTYTCTRPAIARSLGWLIGESTLNFLPDTAFEPISKLYVGGALKNTEPGLNLLFPTGTPTVSDNPGASRTDLTLPSWLLDPGSNGFPVRTSLGVTVARSLTNTDGTVTFANPDGVAGNPIINTTGLTPASRTVTGTAPISIVGDHAAHDLSANRTWALDANGVTYPFLQQGGALSIPGRASNSSGNWADIPATAGSGGVFRESGSALGFGNITEGAVTNLVTDLAGKVTTARNINTMLPLIGGGSLAGDLTLGLNDFVASGPSHARGAVPDPGSTAGATRFLREDATWVTPAGASGAAGGALTGSYPNPSIANSVIVPANFSAFPANTLFGNDQSSSATPRTIGIGTGLSFDPIGHLLNVTVAGGANALGSYWVSGAANAPANAVNWGLLGNGVHQQTTSGSVSTPGVFTTTPQALMFGAATGGGLATDTNFAINPSTHVLTATGSVSLQGPTTTIGAWNGIGKYTSGVVGVATAADLAAAQVWPAVNRLLVSGGPTTAPVGFAAATYNAGTLQLGDGTTVGGEVVVSDNATAATLRFWQNAAVASAVGVGNGVPNGAVTSSLVFSTNNGTSWSERGEFLNGGTLRVTSLAGGGMTKADSLGGLAIAVAGTDYQAPGAYVTGGTGPVTFSGPGVAATSINLAAGSITGTVQPANLGSFTNGGLMWWNAGLVQSPANLYWDAANLRQGIGTNAPARALHVKSTTTANSAVFIENTANGASDYTELGLINSLGVGSRASLFYTADLGTMFGADQLVLENTVGGIQLVTGTGTGYALKITNTGTTTPGNVIVASLAGTGTSCTQVDASGTFSRTGAPCGTGSGAVTSVSGTAGQIIASPTTGAVVLSLPAWAPATDVLVSAGPSSTPTGSTALQVVSGNTIVGGGLKLGSLSPNTLLGLDSGAFATNVSTAGAVSYSSGTLSAPVARDYFIDIPSLASADTALRWLTTSSQTQAATGGTIEYPNTEFVVGHVSYVLDIISSIGTASSMQCLVTRNGTAIGGTTLIFTPGATPPGLYSISSAATGSASTSDTYGIACQYNGNFVTGPFGGTIAFTLHALFLP